MEEMKSPENSRENQNEGKGSPEDFAQARVLASFRKAAPEIQLDKTLLQRLVLLELHSKFNQDSREIERAGVNVLQTISDRDATYHMTDTDFKEFREAALLHDIGKSGPLNASLDQAKAIVKVFSFRGKLDKTMSVEDMVRANFAENEAANIITTLSQFLDIKNISMREFYNSHAKWGADVLQSEGAHISDIVRKIAILHHADKKDGDYVFGLDLGNNPIDILRQRVLMLVDQYQAYIARSETTHEQAIDGIKTDKTKDLRDDPQTTLILEVMLAMGQEKIFSDII